MKPNKTSNRIAHYFVDEAGDMTLFDKRGRVIVGNAGVSKFFMLGVAHLSDPDAARVKLEALRQDLLNDPYFKNVPSMQPTASKTALAFHAKDDLPEVRREVFKILPQFNTRVQVIIRHKAVLATQAQTLYHYGNKLRPQDIYNDLVMRLFRNLLHKADENRIVFAYRGKEARKEALAQAIQRAKHNFGARWGKFPDKPTKVISAFPSDHAGLQVIDYYLWAVQRIYEMGEERFFAAVADDYRLIMDLDDTRQKAYGEWYSSSNPLTLEKIKNPHAG